MHGAVALTPCAVSTYPLEPEGLLSRTGVVVNGNRCITCSFYTFRRLSPVKTLYNVESSQTMKSSVTNQRKYSESSEKSSARFQKDSEQYLFDRAAGNEELQGNEVPRQVHEYCVTVAVEADLLESRSYAAERILE